jgi:peroxiredoxin family protein
MAEPSVQAVSQSQDPAVLNKLTMLMGSNDLDRAEIAFMIATAARAMGMDVHLFFALWGVNLLRRDKHQPGCEPAPGEKKPNIMQKMMRMMMPRGPSRSKLSKMNFAGMGPVMMKSLMKKTGTPNLAELMNMAVEIGVEFSVCSQSMEMMGINRGDIIALPNLQFVGVATFLGKATESRISFFV